MRYPRQRPAIQRIATRSAASATSAGVAASKLVGKQPTPACRAIAGYGCGVKTK